MNLALRVCLVLESLHTLDAEPVAAATIYRWCHCATAPDCQVHAGWAADFERVEAELIAGKRIPDWRHGVPA